MDKIVRAVMRGFDAELAVLLLLLSPSDSTGLKKSLDKVDLHNVLMVCIRVIHAIFQEDGSLVEGVLKQVTVVVLLRLGMENDRAKFVAEAIPWHKIKVTLKDDFNQQRRPPLKFVMQRAVEILSSVVKQGAENEAIQKGAKECPTRSSPTKCASQRSLVASAGMGKICTPSTLRHAECFSASPSSSSASLGVCCGMLCAATLCSSTLSTGCRC